MEPGADKPEQSVDPRRAALEEVLRSHAFARSEQLRGFLRYVCEKEIAGRGSEIKEYSIGVEVFRRGDDYSPASDSTVRSRAWELRQKLDEYYTTEMPGAPLRIVLPKGSYLPAFVEAVRPELQPVPPAGTGPAFAGARPRLRWLPLAASFAAGFCLCALLALAGRQIFERHPGTPQVLLEAWGPLADRQANVLMCIASGLHMVVRPDPFNEASARPTYKAPPELAALFRQHRPLAPDAELYMRPTDSAIPVAVLSGAVIASNTLRSMGASFQVLPERAAPLASFRGRNVILFGDTNNSNAATQLLTRAPLTMGYDAGEKRMVILRKQDPPGKPLFTRKDRDKTGPATVYGLITVLPGEGPSAAQRRIIVVSGISTVGVHGAMEFFSSPEKLENLRGRLRQQGLAGFPAAYQVVVACKSDDTLLLSADYAWHEALR
jgi:hypothetical protein